MNRREKSIAVLPFVNLGDNVDDNYFCVGIAEEMINKLSQITGIFVTSRTSSFVFKDSEEKITTIAEKLGVETIVEGSLRRSGENVRITVQIVNGDEDFHYWSETYDRKFENIFQIQDEIASEVAEKYREIAGHFNIENEYHVTSKSIASYELIMRAKLLSSDLSDDGIRLGINLIDQAIELEPQVAAYHATKGTYLTVLGIIGALDNEKACNLAYDCAQNALKIDSDNVEANSILGFLEFTINGDIPKFYEYVNRALSARPLDVDSYCFISIVESARGNYTESISAIEKVFKVDPLSIIPHYLKSLNLMRLRKYDEALENVNTFLENYPEHINSLNAKGLILLRSNRAEEALEVFSSMPISNHGVPYYAGMGMAYALLGNNAEAEKCLKLSNENDSRIHLSYKENPNVMINFFLGEYDLGFKHLQQDINEKKWYLRFYKTNPHFDIISEDERAKELSGMLIESKVAHNIKPKYSKSGLNDSEIALIDTQLNTYFQEEKPYLDSELSLTELAKSLKISANNLSQVINSQKKKNFFDFVNSYRIEAIIEKLKNPVNKKFTLLSLAYEVGFNSKSTFNASFKKLMGQTPSDYLKTLD